MTTLYDFGSDTSLDKNASTPNGVIQASDGYLYGTAQWGGANNIGTIFRISTNGGSKTFKTVYGFGSSQGDQGYTPAAALLQGADGSLYGTTSGGPWGNYNDGTVFGFSPVSEVFSNLHRFSGPDGMYPAGPLIQGTNGHLYGVTSSGGDYGAGTVFKMSTNGNFASVYSFGTPQDEFGYQPTGLVRDADGTFYGTTQYGGTNDEGDGTLFGLSVSNQTGTLTMAYSFDQENEDGYYPIGALVQAANGKFYGVAAGGGANNNRGAIFAFEAHGAARSVVWFIKDTGGYDNSYDNGQNNFLPSGLISGADGNFYGTTLEGGDNGNGTVYKFSISPEITTNPVSQTVLVGGNVTLQVAATGNGTLTYQWYFNGGKLANGSHVSGATTATLTLTGVTTANAGSYKVIVANASGPATSTVATVTVLAPASVTPASQSVKLGGIAAFSVKASSAPLTYQWLFGGAPLSDNWNISGSAGNQLTISPAMYTNAGSYSVIVSNSTLAVTSTVASLNVVAETTKPSVTITSPKANSRTNAPVLSGTASDNIRVVSVAYWVTNKNNGAITTFNGLAALAAGKGSSNWTIQTALLPGTNILAVQSSNYAGLVSPVESATFFFQVKTPLVLRASPAGMGTFTGVASVRGDLAPPAQTNLYVGEGYTLTAKPATNGWLTNWTTNSIIAGTNLTLTFIMESNLVVTANFATNQFVGMAGRYDGIFHPSDPQQAAETNSGLIENLVLKTNGVYSGKLYLASGTPYPLNGAFDKSGNATEPIVRPAAKGGNVTLDLNILWQSDPRQITGSVQGDGWMTTNLNLYAATTNKSNSTNYTVLLPQDPSVADAPPSYGYGLITNTGSMINMGGALSDGAPFWRSEPINEENQFPVYASLYNNTGLLLGQLSLDTATNAGSLIWFKPAQKTGLYTNAFTTSLEAEISAWTNSAAALAGLFPTNGAQLIFSGGGLASDLTNIVQWTSPNTLKAVTNANFSSGSINLKNGLMTVTFTNAGGKKATAYGTVLQNTNLGGGFFLGATNAGTIILAP